MTSAERPDVAAALHGLRDFQRQTVDYVFQRMYLDPDPAHRFLVADEVGLGKTLVARGVIARMLDHLWDEVPRLDVVYICSNGDIARQNVNRLRIDERHQVTLASRITMLPVELHKLRENKLNFLSFTPSTSFDLRSSMGRKEERALLYKMLRSAWGIDGAGAKNVLQGGAERDSFRYAIDGVAPIDPDLQAEFVRALERHLAKQALQGDPTLRSRFEDLCERFGRSRQNLPDEDRRDRRAVVGELRAVLAASCIEALQPDLVILDEFQRFKHLLGTADGSEGQDEEDEAVRLARTLFEYSDEDSKVRILLLSATPYKMYTLAAEAGSDDHYEDFLQTTRFLCQGDVADIDSAIRSYRSSIYRPGDVAGVTMARDRLQQSLRKVMSRTERLAVSLNRDGMLSEIKSKGLPLEAADVTAWMELSEIGAALEVPVSVELWKSAPYLLNFMEGYQLSKAVEEATSDRERAQVLAKLLGACTKLLLPADTVRSYERLDAGNARLRWLWEQTIGQGLWKLLWLPPSAPYYLPKAPFDEPGVQGATKRLLFSAWKVVPKAIAAVLSYESERLAMTSFDPGMENTQEARDRRRPLLRTSIAEGRKTGMPVFALTYPCFALASLVDPLGAPKAEGVLPTLDDVLATAKEKIQQALRPMLDKAPTDGPEDESWYWAAMIKLDVQEAPTEALWWLLTQDLAQSWTNDLDDDKTNDQEEEGEEKGSWAAHIEEAKRLASKDAMLGKPPADLTDVLALIAVGGPGVCALRSLSRVTGKAPHWLHGRLPAAQIAWGFRSLFNTPEATFLVRGINREEPYWRRVVEYCCAGNLQSVLDEYCHLLMSTEGLQGRTPETMVDGLARAIRPAVSLRTASVGADHFKLPEPESPRIRIERQRMRVRFAVRFGDERSADTDAGMRSDVIRKAFNSPFWPFVLATTSVGQEGLDFHQYCHAVVHWNLPSNPVDLEQREGRVHRYKGHAVRKNVAAVHRAAAANGGGDPWERMFAAANASKDPSMSELVPFWVYPVPGGASIERHVPAYPLSRDVTRLEELKKALAVYRMVFGQPRQQDLVEYLLSQLSPDQVKEYMDLLRIDLTPALRAVVVSGGAA